MLHGTGGTTFVQNACHAAFTLEHDLLRSPRLTNRN